MSKPISNIIATYHYRDMISSYQIPSIDVVGCYESSDEKPFNFDFFDLFDAVTGECLNEGNPFYKIPTWYEAAKYVVTQEKIKKDKELEILAALAQNSS